MGIKNINSASERKRLQTLTVNVSTAGSVVLFLISASVGIAVDSVTLILDASASLVILTGAFLMAFAIKFAIQDIVHADDIANHVLPVLATFVSSILGVFVCDLFHLCPN